MKKILFLLPASLMLGGCMATVSPAGTIRTAYLTPAVEVPPAVTTVKVMPAVTRTTIGFTPLMLGGHSTRYVYAKPSRVHTHGLPVLAKGHEWWAGPFPKRVIKTTPRTSRATTPRKQDRGSSRSFSSGKLGHTVPDRAGNKHAGKR